jgi:hypothetical protein
MRKSEKDDVRSADADDWSLEHGIQSESDDDESTESCNRRENNIIDKTQSHLSQCSRYHREDLSYYGTDGDTSY